MSTYDAIIIGAGHNGLVAAAYLAKAGKNVLVLERRSIVGGSVVTEEYTDGFHADSVWPGGRLRPDIVKYLNLKSFGLPSEAGKQPFISLLSETENLVLDADPLKAALSIKRFSEKDAALWPEFVAFLDRAALFLNSAYATIMPRVPRKMTFEEGYSLAELGLDLRLAGRSDMLRIIRMLPMTALEFVEEWFESEELKAAIASVGVYGVTLGPMSAGTTYNLLHNWLNRAGLSHSNVGHAGDITRALADVLHSAAGQTLMNVDVKQITVREMRAQGVVLSNGEEISADIILSTADPKRTFLSMVGPMELPPEFVWNTQSIKMRGSVAKVHLLTNGDHGIPSGTVVLAPAIAYLERAYDSAKYGQMSEEPYLEITSHGNVVSIHVQFAPYDLRAENWNDRKSVLEQLVIRTLNNYFPKLSSSIEGLRSLTPLDLANTYSLTEGDLNHGQIMLDQLFFMRPIPGWSNHQTPIDGLYLCGSGVHAGGGVSGASGRNAANMVLRAQK